MANNTRPMLEHSIDWDDDNFDTIHSEAHIPRELTEREHKLAKFCEAYTHISFATSSAGVPVEPGVATLAVLAGRESTDAQATPTSPYPIELGLELHSLIERGLLKHKIDAVEMKLVNGRESAWLTIRTDALEAAAEVERDLLLRLHGVNIVIAGLEINSQSVVDAGKKRMKSVF